jgi:sensor histidine kinase YesM
MSNLVRAIARVVYENRNYRFWAFQCTGWAGYSLATFLSITLMDDNVSWPHIQHIGIQAALGVLASWPLRPIYRLTFDSSIAVRVVVAVAAIVVFSAIWTATRIYTFTILSGESGLWQEFHYWFFGSFFVFLSWTVLYYGIHYYELLILEHQKLLEQSALKEKEKARRLRAEASAREAQLKMLRYQLNPHFLFNTLNSVAALVRLRETEQAEETLQHLSAFLRHSLDQEAMLDVTLHKELESLMLYLNIEKARFQDRLALKFDIDPATRLALVPSLILQPIVENAMKYAIGPSEEGGTLEIRAALDGDRVRLSVLDTGPGIVDLEQDLGRGIGLRNTIERLAAEYEGDYSFTAENRTPTGLAVDISFPLRTSAELQQAG